MPELMEYRRNGDVPIEDVLNDYATFLHPSGLHIVDSYTTPQDFILPAEETARIEFEALRQAVEEEASRLFNIFGEPLPSLKQLARISIKELTGCWEVPIYGNGEDVYPEGSPYAGRPRARYGNLSIAGLGEHGRATAHRTMYALFRGKIPDDKWLDHLCNNKQCCWHRHLEAVSPGENTRRGREHRVLVAGQMRLFNPLRPAIT